MPGPTAGHPDPAGDTSTAPATPAGPGTPAPAGSTPVGAAAAAPGRGTVAVLGGLVALGPLTTDLYLPGLPAIAQDLAAEPAAVQLTLTFSMLGVAVGQLVLGPLSDRLGRRPPLLAGLLVYTLASAVCIVAPSLPVLVIGRFLQGAAGAAGLVVGRAIARDRFEGVAMLRFLASISLISGLAPMLAPFLGAQLLRVTSWRGTFGALTALGLLLALVAFGALRETLPPAARHRGGLTTTLRTMGSLLRDLPFLGLLLTGTFAFGSLFGYISGSSVVLQHVYHVSPQTYGVLFGLNSLAIVAVTQLNGRVLARRFTPGALMLAGLGAAVAAGAALLLVTTVWDLGLLGVCPALFVLMGSFGIVLPNTAARALSLVAPRSAGSASALLGTGNFLCGAVVAPLSSLGGRPSAALLATVVLTCALLSAASYLLLCRPTTEAPAPAPAPAT
ncbi:multidrug effflux MFS transporter [Kitasatospora sp. CM 4170]|uniref:Multidrug effflux MFS transporter n=1 Tax=Kitasatospora aburaviensis TaxID=67265 RepID=A0ABW1ENA0_9ACTN|nr:multidrug effflux MFS transporter [Kitasatospora sp. CM 4170]WNM48508.1 multidrug effflux MFS transporter [Kitasatospora sp. CM 4170]